MSVPSVPPPAQVPVASAALLPEVNASSTVESLLNGLLYGISLPERLVRSAVGVTAGTAKELAEFVIPQAFHDSKSYEVMVRNSLGFLLTNVATVSESSSAMIAQSDALLTPAQNNGDIATDPARYIARKAAGNFIDIAGLATLHVSPLWVLAIVSDAAYGTKTYLNELAQELQAQGLIDHSSSIHKVEDLFHAVKQASGSAASAFDQPPLSLEELRTSIEQTRKAINEIDPRSLIPESEISRYWLEMRAIANREQVSLLGVSAAIAMETVEGVKNVSQGTLTGLFVAGKIINRNIFDHYWDSLASINEQGIWNSVRQTYTPYVDLAWGNFTSSRKTWTETVLDPGHFARLWDKFLSLFGSRK
ncbi:MAG: hypothetical protein NTX48_21995 [Planctomycetales bacterium]|nr:hypothetical protein [Planctomycetales bacterium]